MTSARIFDGGRCWGRVVARRLVVVSWFATICAAIVLPTGGVAQSQQASPQLDNAPTEASETIEEPAVASPPRPLAIVSWHLDDADKAGAVDIRPEPQRVWRHTFGAERKSPSRANFDIAKLEADVVLLQGLRMLAHARLLFPASQWRVVASRQIVQPMIAGAGGRARWGSAPRPPTTAVAIRYQRRVRVMGVEHIGEVVASATDTSDTTTASETPAAVAVRLRIDGRFVWVVSADLPAACSVEPGGGATACPARDALAQWQTARRPSERAVIGGPNTTHAPSSPAATTMCRLQAIAMTDGGAPPAPDASTAGATPAASLLPQAAVPPEAEAEVKAAMAPVRSRRLISIARAHNHPLAGCLARLTLD